MGFVIASLAEMTSMHVILDLAYKNLTLTPARAPTSGGQYHWVSEFAPKKYQRLMSYVVGRSIRVRTFCRKHADTERLALRSWLAGWRGFHGVSGWGTNPRPPHTQQSTVCAAEVAWHPAHYIHCFTGSRFQYVACGKAPAHRRGHFSGPRLWLFCNFGLNVDIGTSQQSQ